jgi:PAS domain S-box-containing protein
MNPDHPNGKEDGPPALIEQLLRASELRYRRLFEAARDGILILDFATGRVTDVNPFLTELLGFSHGEMVGKTVGELSPFKDLVSNQAMLERLQREGYVRYDGLPLKTKTGRKISVEFVSNAYQAGDQKVIQCNIRDITERRRLEAQFLQAQKMESIGQLAGGIAHDFNNILTAITGSLFLLSLEAAGQTALLEQVENISAAARRATELVKQILTFSRQNNATREPVQLNHIVQEALKLLRSSLPASIQIQTALPATALVLANPTAIHQVMMNLGTNAWHAMRNRPGVLKVEMAAFAVDADFCKTHPDLRPGPHVRLSVSDTGCGMDRATGERAFDPFFTTKGVGEGTGLGLAVAQGIMKSHEGAISLHSRPGVGTTFDLYFPALATEATVPAVPTAPIPRGRGEQILYVDDEELLAALGKSILERLGYAVTQTTHPQEALAMVRQQPGRFELVITDLTMPGMDGLTLGQQLRQIQPELALILTTGYSGVLTTAKVRELGFQELLDKPSQAGALGEAVDRVLHQRALAKSLGLR